MDSSHLVRMEVEKEGAVLCSGGSPKWKFALLC
jgi:hypothetical protein